MKKTSIMCVVIAIFIAGCAPKIHLPTDDEINQAERNGELIQLYSQLSAEIASKKHVKAKEQAQLDRIGKRIGQREIPEIKELIASEKPPSMALLAALKKRTQGIKQFIPQDFQLLWSFLTKAEQQTKQEIVDREQALFDMIGKPVDEQKQAMNELLFLWSTDNESAIYSEKRIALLTKYNDLEAQASTDKSWERAENIYRFLQFIEPNDKNREALLNVANNNILHQLLEEEFDKAFMSLQSFSAMKGASAYIASSLDVFSILVDHYVEKGSDSFYERKLNDAANYYMKAQQSRAMVSSGNTLLSQQEVSFVSQMLTSSQEAEAEGALGQAVAYLFYVRQLSPAYFGLAKMEKALHSRILERSVKSVNVLQFKSAKEGVGASIAAKVGDYLFGHASGSIHLVDRETLAKVLQEQEIQGMKSDSDSDISLNAADYMIKGRVTESKIDTMKNHSKNTERVITGHFQKDNPAYIAWRKLSEYKREKATEPPKSITKYEKEMVSYNVTVLRKVGILSVVFSLIDANNSTVLYSDSSIVKEKHEGQSSDGVHIGDFIKEMKLARLPSDNEMFDLMSTKLANKIGVKLVTLLGSPEKLYQHDAESFAKAGSYALAVENMANVFVLEQRKDLDADASAKVLLQYIASLYLQD